MFVRGYHRWNQMATGTTGSALDKPDRSLELLSGVPTETPRHPRQTGLLLKNAQNSSVLMDNRFI